VSATQHVEWHERIRALLDAEITNPDFVLWILVAMEPDASVDDDALLRNVRAWLEGLIGSAAITGALYERHDGPS
jgi:hypothetical protein